MYKIHLISIKVNKSYQPKCFTLFDRVANLQVASVEHILWPCSETNGSNDSSSNNENNANHQECDRTNKIATGTRIRTLCHHVSCPQTSNKIINLSIMYFFIKQIWNTLKARIRSVFFSTAFNLTFVSYYKFELPISFGVWRANSFPSIRFSRHTNSTDLFQINN